MLLALLLAACGGGSSDTTATAPTITTQPASVTVKAGAAAEFSVVASGSGTLSYQWRKGGSAISGATSASYAIASVASSDAGSYDVVVSNSVGSVTSSKATLTVSSSSGATAPTITTQPVSQTVASGGSATFSVVATGTAPLSYQWSKGGTAITNATAASYTIAEVASSDAGSYTVKVTNSAGSVTSSAATLTVTAASGGTLAGDVSSAATTFLGTLSSSQKTTTQISFSVDTARKWSNLPAQLVARNGISWGSLSTAQKTAARTLIATALSSAGNSLHEGLQAADDYLAANGGGSSYGNGNFYIAILGTPSSSAFWMLQLSGHHLTYNLAFNGSYKSPTPMFLGIEPKGSFTQSGTTYDPMQAQRTAVSDLGAALTGYSSAKLSGTYSDLLFGANGTGNIDGSCPRDYASVTEHGLPYASLSSTHQALAQAVIRAYVNTQATEYANDLLGTYLSDSSLAQTYVAYSGSGTVSASGNYFRIEGPRLWIEFSVQRGVIFSSDIHYHTIWRDKSADYGGKCGESSTATAPTITTQPASVTVEAGAAAQFSVVASGSGTLSYQWRKGGSAISGATSASYAIASVASSDAGSYDVVVSNSVGSITSSTATLTVSSSSGATAPTITTQPVSQTVASGGSATFSVVATGTAPLSYQWSKGGTAITNATAASYTIAEVASSDAGSYTVKVTNSAGSVTSSAATLTVTAASGGTLAGDVSSAATTFLGTLSSSQKTTTQISFSVDTARKWSNLPAQLVARNGISWGSLSTAQKTAARTLIATALSSAGNSLHEGLQAADDYLAANGGGSSYGNGNFYIAILGTPSSSAFWMLQLSGHHLTYNLAFNGSYKSPTPMFLGIEPKGSFTQSGTTYDPMQAQRTAVSDLGAALTGYSSAKLSGTYSDLLFGANGTGNIDGSCPRDYASVTEHGLPYASLSSTHQALAQAVIRAYVNTQATEYANDLLGTYLSDSSLAQTYVAYSGSGTVSASGNYFRIEGPRLWIEFSVQRGVIFSSDIHYHTIWRDKSADYGGKCTD